MDVLRNGETISKTVSLGELPNDRQANVKENGSDHTSTTPHLGLSLAPANEVAGSGQKGVVVTDVEPGGPAAERGIHAGDAILEVGGKAVADVGDVRAALGQAGENGKRSVLMRVKTADATRFVAVPLANG
ncbi:PDZ domain-containing protein [Bradyrhizobium australiense]|uniref:PDZ domain-containing protein n=1 Tax=Bradyrhizobium australiense TaxID=2721161 RepID=UPI001F31DB1F|nr:PDZ domain-containing protein [Bradyrhizobium australiense]